MQLLWHSFPSSTLKSEYKNSSSFILFGCFPKQRLLHTLCVHTSPRAALNSAADFPWKWERNFASILLHFPYSPWYQQVSDFHTNPFILCGLNVRQKSSLGNPRGFYFPLFPPLGIHLCVAALNQPRCPLEIIVTPSVPVLSQEIHALGSVSAADTVFGMPAMNSAHSHSRQLKGLWLSSVSSSCAQFLFSSSSYACDTFSRNKHFFPR